MTAKELISQYVDTGLQLPEYQVNKLSNQDKKTYIRKRLIAIQSRGYLDLYEMELFNPDERDNYISNLNSDGIATLLINSSDRENVINLLLNNDTLMSKLDSDSIDYLLRISSDKDNVINVLLNNDTLMSKLDSSNINHLLRYSTDTDKIAEMIINAMGGTLGSSGIRNLLDNSTDKDKIAEMIINAMGDKLYSSGIGNLLAKSTDTDKIAEMINNAFGYDKVKELLSGLDSDGIYYLLKYSKDKDGLKRLLDKYGISYENNESVKSLLRKKMIYL